MENTKEITTSPANLLQLAIQKGVDIAQLEKLMDLQERWNKQQAQKKYFIAKSNFQGDCPEIKKTKLVNYSLKEGGSIRYKFAPLGEIAKQIKKHLQKNGLSYRWELEEKDKNIFCTCILSHEEGHSEKTTFSALADDSGKKNDIQKKASTITYLQRYTLISILGISTADEDVDAVGTPKTEQTETRKIEVPEDVKEDILRMTTVKELDDYCRKNCKQYLKLVSFRDYVMPLRKKLWAIEFKNKNYEPIKLP